MESPCVLVLVVVAAVVTFAVCAVRGASQRRDIRGLHAGIARRDDRIAQLSRELADYQARLRDVGGQLRSFEHRLEQFLGQPPAGPGWLRLDEDGRLVEEW